MQSPHLILKFANFGIIRFTLPAATRHAAAALTTSATLFGAAYSFLVLVLVLMLMFVASSPVMRKIYAMRADAVCNHAQVIVPMG